jgi:NADPH:quinone reductase-like Zn-dependent oxidoreductase
MKALCWHGTNDIRCDNVPDPKIEDARDVIIKVTSCAICGSDLHLMDGLMPTMKSGDILGHEFMGEVIETGSAHNKFRKGDRMSFPSTSIAANAASVSSAIIRCASDPTAMRRWRLSSSAIQRPACLATPTLPAVTQAAWLNMSACRWPMSRP